MQQSTVVVLTHLVVSLACIDAGVGHPGMQWHASEATRVAYVTWRADMMWASRHVALLHPTYKSPLLPGDAAARK